MKNTCTVVQVRGKDLERGDVIRLWTGHNHMWREILDIYRDEQELDAQMGETWRTSNDPYFTALRAGAARSFGNFTESYLLARVVVQEKSEGCIEDEHVVLYDYDLYETQSLSARD